jgi:hypothetical protein
MTDAAQNPPRLPDWQVRLFALCAQRHDVPFAWGTSDCALWAADAVLAQTGVDHAAADWRGSYTTGVQAVRRVALAGGLQGIATAALGPAVAPVWAAVGDVVLVHQPEAPDATLRDLLAVCMGTSALAQGPHGLVPVPMTAATAAWKV